ncbi:hypothetical protein KCX83_21475 [Brucella oryzae]|uniref:hypothetical protein n=1 Tax=Brucella oryzae TaxID=335286 RepID=UPI001B8238FD|nr:hypothetical protein [Brucella oryzae]MBR7654863.1 hypothetical protein [Brucella oryzae]
MNNLSWLLYLADVAGKASDAFTFMSFVCVIGGSLGILMCWMAVSDRDMSAKVASFLTVIWLFMTMIAVSGAVLIPAKETIYLIAASEAGEVVVKSDEAKEIMSGLRDIIKEQIAQNLPDAVKGDKK